jgi:bacteriocin biosynthesis cyclodehydratase domain-containing protein
VVLGGKSIKAVGRLIDLLDGTRDIAGIVSQFPDLPEAEVRSTLKRLAEVGIVEDAGEEALTTQGQNRKDEFGAQATFFRIASGGDRMAQDALVKSRVAVFGLGRVGSWVIGSLARAGIGGITGVDSRTVEASLPASSDLFQRGDIGEPRGEVIGERLGRLYPNVEFQAAPLNIDDKDDVARIVHRSSLVLVCQDAPEVAIYRAVNEEAVLKGVPWLKAAIDGFEAQLGPTVMPGETACYTCYEMRSRANWSYYDENLAFEEHLAEKRPEVDYGCLASFSGFLGNLAALEATKLLTGFLPPLTCGKFITFHVGDFDVQSHEIMKLPRCPTCGIVAKRPKTALWSLQGE